MNFDKCLHLWDSNPYQVRELGGPPGTVPCVLPRQLLSEADAALIVFILV